MKQPHGKPPVKPSQKNTPGLKQAKTTRRGFLEISAAAVAGLTLSPLAQSSPLATSASASSMTSTSAQAPAKGSGSQGNGKNPQRELEQPVCIIEVRDAPFWKHGG